MAKTSWLIVSFGEAGRRQAVLGTAVMTEPSPSSPSVAPICGAPTAEVTPVGGARRPRPPWSGALPRRRRAAWGGRPCPGWPRPG
jgi:hypothetical protein